MENNINEIMKQINELLHQNNREAAEQKYTEALSYARAAKENGLTLQLLNELLGYYRETGQTQKSFETATQARELADTMGLKGSVPYATTLQNIANAYRAGGRLTESLQAYEEAGRIYERELSPEDMLVAGLANNLSLLYQEMGEFQKAKQELLKALQVVSSKGAEFEIAATHTNLAATCLELGESEEAMNHAGEAVSGFERLEQEGTHYCAALTVLGSCYYAQQEYSRALELFHRALQLMEERGDRSVFYQRLQERRKACEQELQGGKKGLELCRSFYEAYGKPMLEQQFGAYKKQIAVGLVGEGSDCFGYDDIYSRDHDFGPDFCLWVSDEVYGAIGKQLQSAYEQLPTEFDGYQRVVSPRGAGRRGVRRISEFYQSLVGAATPEEIDWQQVADSGLAAAVNGEVFADEEGEFTRVRRQLQQGYPLRIRYLKLAQAAGEFAQCAQYNFERMRKRGDAVTAQLMLSDGIKAAMKLQHYIENRYPVHDKWLLRSLQETPAGRTLAELIEELAKAGAAAAYGGQEEERKAGSVAVRHEQEEERKVESVAVRHGQEGESRTEAAAARSAQEVADKIEAIARFLVEELYEAGFISDKDSYLDAHTAELLFKATVAEDSVEQLAEKIAQLEFQAFDKVCNVGGRASCQNDWYTFSIMRKSQYLTFSHPMLLQYYYEFTRELKRGRNLITEKYGRMMESTAREEFETMKSYFPTLSEEKKRIIEQIVQIQVVWMEEFAGEYPALAGQARSVHSYEDHLYNTSYETYLRGEISTYSDKLLELYGRYVVEYARTGKNLAYEIMKNTTRLYGYHSLQDAEEAQKRK